MGCLQSTPRAAAGGEPAVSSQPLKPEPTHPPLKEEARRPPEPEVPAECQAAVSINDVAIVQKTQVVTPLAVKQAVIQPAGETVLSPPSVVGAVETPPPERVASGIAAAAVSTSAAVPEGLDAAACGVSLRFFRRFFREHAASITTDITTREIVESMVKTATAARRCRYADLVPAADLWAPSKGPMYMIVHSWDIQYSTLVNRLNERFHKEVDADVYLWLDLFAIDQWRPVECASARRVLCRPALLLQM